jgi:N-acetylated-alpha-linked acidic dipeptidase
MSADSVPSLGAVFLETLNEVKFGDGEVSVLARQGGAMELGSLGSGSDFTPFLQHLGVASIDFMFESRPSLYGVYHSVFDSYTWLKTHVDPDFLVHRTLARVWGLLALKVADAEVLPLSVRAYANAMLRLFNNGPLGAFLSAHRNDSDGSPERRAADALGQVSAQLDALLIVSTELDAEVTQVRQRLEGGGSTPAAHGGEGDDEGDGVGEARSPAQLNELLMRFERTLLSNRPLYQRSLPWYRHVVYAPALYGGYAASVFPSMVEPLEAGDLGALADAAADVRLVLRSATQALERPLDPNH